MQRIPISALRDIAVKYGWDQLVLVARKVGPGGEEQVVTYGEGREHSDVAARAGMAIRTHLLRWPSLLSSPHLKIWGLSRDSNPPRHLTIVLSREPTDDELRELYEFLAPRTSSPQEIEDGA